MNDIMELCNVVRQTAYDIHLYHAHGHLEKVYENALTHRLRKAGLDVKQQHPLTVFDEDGVVIGEYLADLIIENQLIVELKACRTLADEHVAQLLGYLKSSKHEHGLLINFGSSKFQIKKYVLSKSREQQQKIICPVYFFKFCVLCVLSRLNGFTEKSVGANFLEGRNLCHR